MHLGHFRNYYSKSINNEFVIFAYFYTPDQIRRLLIFNYLVDHAGKCCNPKLALTLLLDKLDILVSILESKILYFAFIENLFYEIDIYYKYVLRILGSI